MSPMNTGGMGPMTTGGGNPMQSGLLQGLASQGQYGDTELAHITPTEGAILKALGGSGDINQGTGLRQYHYKSPPWSKHNRKHAGDYLSKGYENVDKYVFGGVLPGGYDTGDTWQEFVANFGSAWGLDIKTNEKGELQYGDYPGSDKDWRAGMKATDRFQDYLASTGARAQQLKGFLTEDTANFLQRGRQEFRPQQEAYASQVGRMDAANVGGGVGPINPLAAYTTNINQGLDKLNRDYSDERYSLLSSTRDAHSQYLNNLISPEYKAATPSYDEMISEMPWLHEPEVNIG